MFSGALNNDKIHQEPAQAACGSNLTIPIGESSYPVTIPATFMVCNPNAQPSLNPACLPGMRMPPVPPGNYNAIFVAGSSVVATPAPIPVLVTAP